MRNWLPALISFVLGAPWLAIGIFMAVDQHRTNRDSLQTTGTVLASKLTSERVYDDKSKKWDSDYHAVIEYEYEIAEQSYKSKLIGHRWEPTDKTTCEELVKGHPAGKSVPVFYLPDKPEEGFILRDYSFGYYLLIFIGLPLPLVSIAVITGTAKGKGDPEPSERRKAVVYGLIALLWYAAVLFTIVHFFVIARQGLSGWRIVGLSIVTLLGFIPAKAAWRAYKQMGSRSFSPRWE